ncbi:heavy-metal-associated domain-containing protein [Streptomyces sp. NPDC047081]|uniref:heavy-metal-associated domain-containing protein n=1 Tax=Streptomyces sp. NPDC047081 TaxID=3154706 RepID=UPI0033E7E4EE
MTTETNTSTSSCCGGSGSCGSGTTSDVQIVGTGATTTVYRVSGMTCGHCEGAVSKEISALDGVSAVTAVAKTGEVTVTSTAALDEEAVRAAVEEAGYELVGRA